VRAIPDNTIGALAQLLGDSVSLVDDKVLVEHLEHLSALEVGHDGSEGGGRGGRGGGRFHRSRFHDIFRAEQREKEVGGCVGVGGGRSSAIGITVAARDSRYHGREGSMSSMRMLVSISITADFNLNGNLDLDVGCSSGWLFMDAA
jgi:hypothetical protein